MSQTTDQDPSPTSPAPEPDSAAVPPATTTPASGVDAQLEALRRESAENHERYLRAVADLENFRKRMVREKEEVRQYGTSAVMEDLLPILDNLALGVAAARQETESKAIVDGVDLVLQQFKSALDRHGLKEVNPTGKAFDPHLHECIAQQPHGTVPPEHVFQVVRPGYTLNGRLLRPASVMVSSGPAAGGKPQD